MRERRVPQPLAAGGGEFKRKMRFSAICALIKRKFTRLGKPSPKSAKIRFHCNYFARLKAKNRCLAV
jgi:hypothetical protein